MFAFNTVPNQRTITVHRQALNSSFLGIKNENWQYAARDLGPHALRLYLYLAANADGYRFALSPEAIRQAVGIPRSTYHDQFKVLLAKGYLVCSGDSSYDFYEVPFSKRECPACAGDGCKNNTVAGGDIPQSGNIVLPEDIEINNNRPLLNTTGINSAGLPAIGAKMTPEEEREYLQFLKEHEAWIAEEHRTDEEKDGPPLDWSPPSHSTGPYYF